MEDLSCKEAGSFNHKNTHTHVLSIVPSFPRFYAAFYKMMLKIASVRVCTAHILHVYSSLRIEYASDPIVRDDILHKSCGVRWLAMAWSSQKKPAPTIQQVSRAGRFETELERTRGLAGEATLFSCIQDFHSPLQLVSGTSRISSIHGRYLFAVRTANHVTALV